MLERSGTSSMWRKSSIWLSLRGFYVSMIMVRVPGTPRDSFSRPQLYDLFSTDRRLWCFAAIQVACSHLVDCSRTALFVSGSDSLWSLVLVKGLGHDGAGVLRSSKVTAKTRFRVLLWSIHLFFDALVCFTRLPSSAQAWYGFC